GVQIASYGPIGASAQYGIRGTASSQVLVLVDGQPAPGGFADSVQLGTISTAGVARIEIVEGGGSTLYGTGAIGGIINIITSDKRGAASATLSYGTFNDAELQLDGDGFSFDRIVAHNAYALPPSAGFFGPNPTTRDNSDFESTTARYGADRKVGALDVAFHASLASDDLGAAGFFPYLSSTSREHDVNDNGSLTFTHRRAQSSASLSLFGASQQITFGCDIAVDTSCFQTFPSLSTETRDGLSLRDVVDGSNERTVYGVDLSRGVVRADDGNGDINQDAMAQSAAYVQQTWIGARNEYYAGIRGERDGALGGEFSPSIGARFDLATALTLKVNAASAFRAPNASELYFPGYGSVAQGLGLLQPERAQVSDITLEDARLLGGTSLGWFDNYTKDLIVATCVANCTGTPGTFPDYAPQNVDRAHMMGFTFDTRTLPLNGVSVTLNATDLYLASDLDTQARLPDDPVFTVNLGLAYAAGPRAFVRTAGISERLVGQRATIDPTQPPFSQAIPYGDLTAFVSLRVAPHASLTLRGLNLGNERYAEVSGYPMPGRSFIVELHTH
ncbi:MAG TPA: TonB-dependent receptor, partial [Candidatus Baltobacteraceae bacterium]|nr:TonB-dependent receptor [Candidatus Baltobacteraceae bacterium]